MSGSRYDAQRGGLVGRTLVDLAEIIDEWETGRGID